MEQVGGGLIKGPYVGRIAMAMEKHLVGHAAFASPAGTSTSGAEVGPSSMRSGASHGRNHEHRIYFAISEPN